MNLFKSKKLREAERGDEQRGVYFDAWAKKNDREIALRQTLVSVADALERATKADDNERELLFHISLIEKLCRDAVFKNETERKFLRVGVG